MKQELERLKALSDELNGFSDKGNEITRVVERYLQELNIQVEEKYTTNEGAYHYGYIDNKWAFYYATNSGWGAGTRIANLPRGLRNDFIRVLPNLLTLIGNRLEEQIPKVDPALLSLLEGFRK